MTTLTDQLAQRIQFFEASAQAKDNIMKSEAERVKLEIELNKLVNSDQAIVREKASKLRSYYQKICEDEQKSTRRNQELLKDLQRVDSQFQAMESKLERLANLKKECESYLAANYPSWSQQNQIGAGSSNFNLLAELGASDTWRPPPRDADSHGLQALINSIKTTHNINSDLGVNLNANQFQSAPRPAENTEFIKKMIPTSQNTSNYYPPPPLQPTSAGPASSGNFIHDHGAHSFNVLGALATTGGDNLIKEYEREIKRQDTTNMNNTTFNNTASSVTFGTDVIIDAVTPAGPVSSGPAIPRNTQDNANWASSPKAAPASENVNATKALIQRLTSDSPTKDNAYQNESLRQELTLKGLYNLLDYIESQLNSTINPEKYYQQVEPHYKHKLEIMKLANENMPLNDLDSASVSMVVNDQLPIVIRKYTRYESLFTPDLISLSVADINEQVVTNHLKDPNDKQIWARLVKHWSLLKRMSILDASTIGKQFGPALIGGNSAYGTEKAMAILEKIMILAPDPLGDSKSLTETSINQELLIASSSKLKENPSYQQFLMNTTQSSGKNKKTAVSDDSDEDDSIDKLVAPKSSFSPRNSVALNNSGKQMAYVGGSWQVKSPRADEEFDFSRSSMSEMNKKKSINDVLSSVRSSQDKKFKNKLPYRKYDETDESSSSSTSSNTDGPKQATKSQKSDYNELDFYN